MLLEVGSSIPKLNLEDQDGKSHSKKDYEGQWLLVYFYPKDDTPGCTKEACGFRDNWSSLKKKGCTILGISADSVEKHKKFTDKYELPFTLLSDPEKSFIDPCGAWQEKSMYGKKYMGIARISYLVNPEGVVAKVYPKVKAPQHAEEVLNDLDDLQS